MPLAYLPLELLLDILDFLDLPTLATFLAASPSLAEDLISASPSLITLRPTVLHEAAALDYASILPLLLRHIDPSISDPSRRSLTPLHAAASSGATAAVKCLLAHGAKLSSNYPGTKFTRMPAIFFAAQQGHLDIVLLLLAHPETKSEARSLALEAAAGEGQKAVCATLLKYRHRPEHITNALCHAAAEGSLETVKLLLFMTRAQRVSVWTQDAAGSPPLHHAAQTGKARVVRWLLEQPGCEKWINVQDSEGYTALHFAARGGHVEVYRALVEAGADTDVRNGTGDLPVLEAWERDQDRGEEVGGTAVVEGI